MNLKNHQKLLWKGMGLIALGIGVLKATDFWAYASSPLRLDARTQQAMVDAIHDEYRARAFYTAVIEQFGAIRPFSNIVQAEERHTQLWNTLFAQYGLPIPADPFVGNVEAPDTLQIACQMGIDAEIANVAMYDSFLEFVQEPDLRAAFTQLRNVSQNNHKPAFERCAQRTDAQGLQQRQGWGPGRRR